MKLVSLAVEEASEQDNDNEYNCQDDSSAHGKATKVFTCVMLVILFSHESSVTSVYLGSYCNYHQQVLYSLLGYVLKLDILGNRTYADQAIILYGCNPL